MASAIWRTDPAPTFDSSARLAAGAVAYFYKGTTKTPLVVYRDVDHVEAHSQPVVANSAGVFPAVYLPYEDYGVLVKTATGETIFEAAGIENPAPSGGGGDDADPTIFKTGDVKWKIDKDPDDGWVRLINGASIGSAISGATERANEDCFDLFEYGWTKWSNDIAPVSGGRGASASADWLAGKTLTLPAAGGKTLVAYDSGGDSLQIVTTGTFSNGLPTVTVASADGLAIDMWVRAADVLVDKILSISGTTVTLASSYTGSNGSKSFKASFFKDPTTVGHVGGAVTTTATVDQMPEHNHTSNMSGVLAGGVISSSGGSLTFGTQIISDAGGGQPLVNMQPSITACCFMKL